jgi:hypothetical protein
MEDSMPAPSVQVGSRNVLAAGTVICTGDEVVTLRVEETKFQIVFEVHDGIPPGFEFKPQGQVLRIVLTNADAPTGSSLETKVAKNAAGKDIVMALFVHSHGPEKRRQLAYTFSV